MRYATGGGCGAAERQRRERLRLEAAERFALGATSAQVARELRVTERSVARWRQSWAEGGVDALRSTGPASRCRLNEAEIARLEVVLERGPLAQGWEDQRWTLARIREVVWRQFRVDYTVVGVWKLLRRNGWSCQMPARRAIERDEAAVEVWKKQVWPQAK